MNKKWIRCFAFLYFALVVFPGALGPVQAQSVLDEAEKDYEDGIVFLDQEDLGAAMEAFDQAISKDPDMFFLLSGNGIFEKILNSGSAPLGEQVVLICQSIITKKKDSDFFVYYYLGWAELNIGNADQAILELEKAEKLMERDGIVSRSVQDLLERARLKAKDSRGKKVTTEG